MTYYIDKKNKTEYLKSIEQTSQSATYELYKKLINKLDEFEEYKGISAMNMSKNDFIELLTSLNSTSLSVLYTYKSAIKGYLTFSTDTQRFKIGILQIDNLTKEDLVNCLNTNMEMAQFITKDEYLEILETDEGNYQDKLVVVLLWNKIKGEKQFDEIRNLKKSDVDLINKTIKVNDRFVFLEGEKELEIIKKAMVESRYLRISKHGHIIEREYTDYVEGEYLVKATCGRRNSNADNNQCPASTLMNRLSRYFTLALKRAELTGLKIYKSSIYYDILMHFKYVPQTKDIKEYVKQFSYEISPSNIQRELTVMYEKMQEQGLL